MFSQARQGEVLADVARERARQRTLWGDDPYGPRALTILVEEVGEVAAASLDGSLADVYEELIQVAAVAVKWAEDLREIFAALPSSPPPPPSSSSKDLCV